MLYRYQSDWLGPLLLAAALAGCWPKTPCKPAPLRRWSRPCAWRCRWSRWRGACYNFCVYFAAEPQLMGQNPALYENVSRLVQFWL